MKRYKTILLNYKEDIAWLFLNRPGKSNALDIEMIREIADAITTINNDKFSRFIIINSKGKSFCSGADLNWMSDASYLSKEQNLSECMEMAELYYTIYNSDKIIIISIPLYPSFKNTSGAI